MGIKAFFHKIKTGFVRMGESSIPYTPPEKQYGNRGEDGFVSVLKTLLSDCRVKRNVVIQTPEGNAEIDCLILYKAKLFAVEVKRWKGNITETEDGFVQRKRDRWTDEIHIKYHKSPFKQLNRAIYLLRKQIPQNAWINAVVFFEDAEEVSASEDNAWFTEVSDLAEYILHSGKSSFGNNANAFFEQCTPADHLYANSWGKSLHCVIDNASLQFNIGGVHLSKQDISSIDIYHHWSYDTLQIKAHNSIYDIELENVSITVVENGRRAIYALCKLDRIEIGK